MIGMRWLPRLRFPVPTVPRSPFTGKAIIGIRRMPPRGATAGGGVASARRTVRHRRGDPRAMASTNPSRRCRAARAASDQLKIMCERCDVSHPHFTSVRTMTAPQTRLRSQPPKRKPGWSHGHAEACPRRCCGALVCRRSRARRPGRLVERCRSAERRFSAPGTLTLGTETGAGEAANEAGRFAALHAMEPRRCTSPHGGEADREPEFGSLIQLPVVCEAIFRRARAPYGWVSDMADEQP